MSGMAALPLPEPAFVEARWYTKANRRPGDVWWLVIHDMEAPEKGDTAEAVARYFATTDRKASAHRNFDSDSEVLCVRLDDVAYHAPGANARGIGYEHAGYAKQQRHEWLDDYGRAMLARSAARAALDCERWRIPVDFVRAEGLRAGRRGITTHYEVSMAWRKTSHTDPGVGFPIDYYLDLVRANMLTGSPAPNPTSGGGSPLSVNRPPVTVLDHPAGGYWEVAEDGGIFSFGGAPAPPDNPLPGIRLNAPIVDADLRPQGDGIWLVGSDGGVFALGNAVSYGSMGGTPLNAPVVAISATLTGHGYRLLARDGGLFTFGDAAYAGSVSYAGT